MVQVSSPSVAHAGEPLVGAPAGAADPAHARGNYARSKAQAELLALAADAPDFAVTAVRPHLVWGPGDTQLIGRIAERARAGRLVLVDDGAALIDTTYVDNAAEAIAQAVERCTLPDVHGRAFVISNGQPRTVFELVSRIALAAGGTPPTRHIPFAAARSAGRAGRAGVGAVRSRRRAADDRVRRGAAGHGALVRPAARRARPSTGGRGSASTRAWSGWRRPSADARVALPGFRTPMP